MSGTALWALAVLIIALASWRATDSGPWRRRGLTLHRADGRYADAHTYTPKSKWVSAALHRARLVSAGAVLLPLAAGVSVGVYEIVAHLSNQVTR